MKSTIIFSLVLALALSATAPTYVPAGSTSGFSDCYICIINGGTFCNTPNTI